MIFDFVPKECNAPVIPLLVGSAATAATTTTAAAAATTGLIGAGGAVSLGGALSFASAASTLFGGFQQASAAEDQAEQQARSINLQADQDLLDAKQEELRGKQESNDILERLNSTMAQQRVAAAANGLDINFGTPVNIADTTQRRGELQLSTTRNDAQSRALSRRRQATQRRIGAANTLSAGISEAQSARFKGITGAASTIGNNYYRGVVRG